MKIRNWHKPGFGHRSKQSDVVFHTGAQREPDQYVSIDFQNDDRRLLVVQMTCEETRDLIRRLQERLDWIVQDEADDGILTVGRIELGAQTVQSQRAFPQIKELVYYQSLRDPDLIVVFDGETYRDQMAGPDATVLESFDEADYVIVSRLRSHGCEYGNYPWDHWKAWALTDGVPEDLADLGRALIREADQHGWDETLQAECGWLDSGESMIQLARTDSKQAKERWQHLMATDGERGHVDAAGEWIPND